MGVMGVELILGLLCENRLSAGPEDTDEPIEGDDEEEDAGAWWCRWFAVAAAVAAAMAEEEDE